MATVTRADDNRGTFRIPGYEIPVTVEARYLTVTDGDDSENAVSR